MHKAQLAKGKAFNEASPDFEISGNVVQEKGNLDFRHIFVIQPCNSHLYHNK